MRRAFVAALSATLAGGLVWTAIGGGATVRVSDSAGERAAQRATGTYKGEFKRSGPETSITVVAKIKNGEAKQVKSMRYRAPMTCEESGPGIIGISGWSFRGVRVNDRGKFSVRGGNGESPESTLAFKGKFTKNLKKVRGTFKTHEWFEATSKLPAEYCDLPKTKYVAKR